MIERNDIEDISHSLNKINLEETQEDVSYQKAKVIKTNHIDEFLKYESLTF